LTPEPNTSVDQVFDAFNLLARGGSLGVADVARELGIPTSTAHRVLATAFDSGFADRDPSGSKYELGARAHMLVHGLFRQFGVQAAALPYLTRIAADSGETTTLEVRLGWLAVRMVGFEGRNEIHAARLIGQTSRLADTAGGLAILAHLDEAELGRYLTWEGGGRRQAARTRAVGALLDAVRESGYARQPDPAGGAEVAFPVCFEGRAVAAICIDGNGPLVSEAPQKSHVARVRKAVRELEGALAADPELARDPFSHLDPDELTAQVI
jgi:DNA-binding IclR family transcriptional regulator